jgi:hypothetical protein
MQEAEGRGGIDVERGEEGKENKETLVLLQKAE